MRMFVPSTAVVALLVPTIVFAQTTCASVTNCPPTNVTNTFSKYQLVCVNGGPCGLSPKVGVAYNAIGAMSGGENDLFDGVSQNGFSQYQAERFDTGGTGVGANEVVGAYLGSAYMDTGSDPADAGILLFTTERQTTGHNGMGAELDYTANGSTALARGLSVSPQGLGGVTIGGGFASNNPYSYSSPADLGAGTLNAANDIDTAGHIRTDGGHGTITSCGTSPQWHFGTDQAGSITVGSAVTSCNYNFAKAWATAPVCMAQVWGAGSPAAYLTNESTTSITVAFSSSFSGTFQFICMGVS